MGVSGNRGTLFWGPYNKDPTSRVLGPKNHSEYRFWDLKPYYLGTWTLWAMHIAASDPKGPNLNPKALTSETVKGLQAPKLSEFLKFLNSLNPVPYTLNPKPITPKP